MYRLSLTLNTLLRHIPGELSPRIASYDAELPGSLQSTADRIHLQASPWSTPILLELFFRKLRPGCEILASEYSRISINDKSYRPLHFLPVILIDQVFQSLTLRQAKSLISVLYVIVTPSFLSSSTRPSTILYIPPSTLK